MPYLPAKSQASWIPSTQRDRARSSDSTLSGPPEKMRIVLAPSRDECSIQSRVYFIVCCRLAESAEQKFVLIAVPLTSKPSRVHRPLRWARYSGDVSGK